MSKYLDWFWRVLQEGQGPDFVFAATFDKTDNKKLKEIVDKNLPSSYVSNKNFSGFFRHNRKNCSIYENYIDQHTYNKLANKKWWSYEPCWLYGKIEVCDNHFYIENVYGSGQSGETDLIIALAESKELSLQEWEVGYQDSSWGCIPGIVAHGHTLASLLDYLTYNDTNAKLIRETLEKF